MKKRFSLLMAALLALTFCMAACSGGGVSGSAPESGQPIVSSQSQDASSEHSNSEAWEAMPNEGLKVALTVIDLSNVFFVSLSNGIKDKCEELGFTVTINDGKSDAAVQISAIENFIVQGVDVIIVAPVDSIALEPVLQQAKDAGITIINSNPEVAVKDAFIGIEEYDYGYAAGRIGADWINANIEGQAKIGILNRPVTEQLIQRSNGFKDGVTQNSDAVIVAEQTANTAELGLKAVESILQSNPDITGFVCQNDTAALGAYEALIAAGRKPEDTFVVGVDGLQTAFEKISEGGIFIGTVDSNPYGTGQLCVETALEVRKNGPIAETIHPVLVPVTKDNVAQYLE